MGQEGGFFLLLTFLLGIAHLFSGEKQFFLRLLPLELSCEWEDPRSDARRGRSPRENLDKDGQSRKGADKSLYGNPSLRCAMGGSTM